jgi:fimbrial chaperone protein
MNMSLSDSAMQHLSMRHLVHGVVVSLLCIAVLLSPPVFAGNFAVSPIRLDFDHHNKSGAITIRNQAKNDLKVQIDLYEWTQGEDGKDNYRKSDDLLYFPRLAKIGAGESRVVRVGLRRPTGMKQEKQYRLFVEELPGQAPRQGMALAVAVRFGVPLFVKPAAVEAAGAIEEIGMRKGRLRIRIKNSGNVHFRSPDGICCRGRHGST